MIIIFSIIGLFILGTFVRGFLDGNDVSEKPKGASEWIVQIVFSIIIGLIVWAVIPRNCNTTHHEIEPRYEQE